MTLAAPASVGRSAQGNGAPCALVRTDVQVAGTTVAITDRAAHLQPATAWCVRLDRLGGGLPELPSMAPGQPELLPEEIERAMTCLACAPLACHTAPGCPNGSRAGRQWPHRGRAPTPQSRDTCGTVAAPNHAPGNGPLGNDPAGVSSWPPAGSSPDPPGGRTLWVYTQCCAACYIRRGLPAERGQSC